MQLEMDRVELVEGEKREAGQAGVVVVGGKDCRLPDAEGPY